MAMMIMADLIPDTPKLLVPGVILYEFVVAHVAAGDSRVSVAAGGGPLRGRPSNARARTPND